MGVQAAWNGFAWGYGRGRARPLENLATGRSVSVSQSKDKKGNVKQKSNYDLVTVTAQFTLASGAGYTPLTEFNKLKKKLGSYAPLFLHGKKFMKCNFLLDDVSMSGTLLDGRGRIVSCTVSVAWKEYRSTKKGLMAQTGAAAKLRPGVKKYSAKKSALQIRAPKAARNKKKPKNRQMAKWGKKGAKKK